LPDPLHRHSYVHDAFWYEQQANEALEEAHGTTKVAAVHYLLQRADILSRMFMGALMREEALAHEPETPEIDNIGHRFALGTDDIE
jgi:hypothetical protein